MFNYVPKNKVVIILSSTIYMWRQKLLLAQRKKTEINEFYNLSKATVDAMDKILSRYTIKRSTRKWLLAFFYNLFDITFLTSYIVY